MSDDQKLEALGRMKYWTEQMMGFNSEKRKAEALFQLRIAITDCIANLGLQTREDFHSKVFNWTPSGCGRG